jgi:hypothetical protein
MTRAVLIERLRRQIAGGIPTDDMEITPNLVASYLPDAIAAAAKASYIENIKIDGVGFVNNGFYATFSGLTITKDETDDFQYSLTLPEIPVGISRNEGIATLQFKKNGQTSYTGIPLSINQWGYRKGIRPIQNKITYLPEGRNVKIETTLPLNTYTGTVRMISGGTSDMNAEINVPAEWIPMMSEYILKSLMIEKNNPQDTANDGANIK